MYFQMLTENIYRNEKSGKRSQYLLFHNTMFMLQSCPIQAQHLTKFIMWQNWNIICIIWNTLESVTIAHILSTILWWMLKCWMMRKYNSWFFTFNDYNQVSETYLLWFRFTKLYGLIWLLRYLVVMISNAN